MTIVLPAQASNHSRSCQLRKLFVFLFVLNFSEPKDEACHMTSDFPQSKQRADTAAWKEIVARYQEPSTPRALWQIVNTLVPYGLLWYLMYRSYLVSWWITVPLAVLAGGFVVRIFIIFHDCGHGSYFKSRLANDIVGFIAGVLTFTPYYHWRWEHSIHHATSGHLDKRGTGDVWTLTVEEYLKSSRWRRFAYRLSRNPFILFVMAPVLLWSCGNGFPRATQTSGNGTRSIG